MLALPPYEDELLYSTMARYHYYSGNRNFKDTIEETHGSRSAIPTLYLPSNLEHLCRQLSLNITFTPEYLIQKHTMAPAYLPFLPRERQSKIISEMISGNGVSLYLLSGIMAGSLGEIKRLRYCPTCVLQDFEHYDEAYFHRAHHFQGVKLCYKHGCYIRDYPIRYRDTSRLEYIRLDHRKINLDVLTEQDPILHKHYMLIATSANFLLNVDLEMDQWVVYKKYISVLRMRGLLTCKEHVKQQDLYDEFSQQFNNNFLKIIGCEIDSGNEFNWLKCLTRKPDNAVHPLRHILFIIFLYGSMQQFLNTSDDTSYFGTAPWRCLNPAAEHYGNKVINDCKVAADYKTRQPVGTFACMCGFVYSRRGPDQRTEDQFKIGRVKCYGPVWEEKLIKLVKERSHSIREIARLLKSDSKTIVKYARKQGLDGFLKSKMSMHTSLVEPSGLKRQYSSLWEQYTRDILKHMKLKPEETRNEIRRALAKQYIWLYRNDRGWFEEHLPSPILRKDRSENYPVTVYWEQRDTDILSEIDSIYPQLMANKKPVRVTRSLIGRVLGISALLEKHRDKLPKTRQLLDYITESVEEFQLRRVDLICSNIQETKELKVWKILKKAGLRSDVSERVIERIQQDIDVLKDLISSHDEHAAGLDYEVA